MPHATAQEDPYNFSTAWAERDSYGYGRNPPNPHWPNGAKVAVNFVLNYEEGGERTIEDGDAAAETNGHEMPGLPAKAGARAPETESQFDYGSRVGIWRILDLFEERGIPITFYAVARAFERNLDVAQAAMENGHEVASHCYRWLPHHEMEPAEEEELIRKAVQSFRKTSKVPCGWFYGRPSANSCALVEKVYKEEGEEFLYWADYYADELPVWTCRPTHVSEESKEGLLLMPYNLHNNDFKLWHGQYGSAELWARNCVDSVKTVIDEAKAGKRHGYITIPLHTRWIAQPGRFQALKRMVEDIVAMGDVWFATRESIARHWIKEYPYGSLPKRKPTHEKIA
ncbi:uncharacterized protein JCM10292_001309 [Rhodotorula paludigena]|uniref:uncharacterized protein n=1 Tax=Rhodotorula paludigena TaxID=86838 RepID=UPI0031788005